MARRPGEPRTRTFRKRDRLSHDRDYAAVFAARLSSRRGPLVVYGRPNGLDRGRLGLSVGRKAGGAVTRVAIKRRLREAFRHFDPSLAAGLDVVVAVRRHEVMKTPEYAGLLREAIERVGRLARRRARRASGGPGRAGEPGEPGSADGAASGEGSV